MIDGLKPYPKMKESGVPWLGEVPEHWEVLPALAVYIPRQVKNFGLAETTVLSLSYGRIIVKPPEKLRGLVPESFETYQIVDPGNIVVRTTDLQNDRTSLRIGYSRHRGIITSAYMCLETTTRVSHEFGYQFLNAYDLLKIIYGLGSGLRQNLDFNDIKRMPVLVPPLREQATIVRFLDHADQRIRRYIGAKHKLIKLLLEQKQAISQHAVTRGLDPKVRLKPSGEAWLGDVPANWEVRPAKWFFGEIDERSLTGNEELLSVSHVTGVTPRSQKNITMFMAESYIAHKRCRPGDLIINTMWAWMGALGVSPYEGIVSPAYGVYRPHSGSSLLGEYADLLFRTRTYIDEYVCRSTGIQSSRLRLYPEQFLSIAVVCPPREEQRAILEHIKSETAEAASVVASASREIDLLREYRTRLITNVVTGKLDVREAAARLPDEIIEPEQSLDLQSLAEVDDASEDRAEEDETQVVAEIDE